jgi:hypothetical protein
VGAGDDDHGACDRPRAGSDQRLAPEGERPTAGWATGVV